MSEPIHLAGYRRIRNGRARGWRERYPQGSATDVDTLTRWSARYAVAGLTGAPLPHAGPAELAALARLEADQ